MRMLSLWLLIAMNLPAVAQEWTRFRGPNGSGVSHVTTIPVTWTDADFNWRITLPGSGNSSPVIWGERLFVTSADASTGERFLSCINAVDGATIWQRSYTFSRYRVHKNNTFASNTPTVDDQRVYVLWQSADDSALHALDHDGQPVWQFNMGAYKSGHGTGSSPIVYQDLVIVCNDHDGESFLIALDSATGRDRWKLPRIGDRACYSTPCIYEQPGRDTEIIFTHSYRGITGVDAETGKRTWEIDVFGTHAQRAVGSPIIFNDLVIGTSGFTTAEKNVVAVRPSDTATGCDVEEVYRLSKTVPHIPTPLIHDERLFLLTDTGILVCADAATGKGVWQHRLGGNFQSSPICVAGRLYCIDLDGLMSVIDVADEFEVLAQYDFGESARATPAVSGGAMFVRTTTRLYSLGGE